MSFVTYILGLFGIDKKKSVTFADEAEKTETAVQEETKLAEPQE
jgi:hypothetical protein